MQSSFKTTLLVLVILPVYTQTFSSASRPPKCYYIKKTLHKITQFIRFQSNSGAIDDTTFNVTLVHDRTCKLKLDLAEKTFYFSYYYFKNVLTHLHGSNSAQNLIDKCTNDRFNIRFTKHEQNLIQMFNSSINYGSKCAILAKKTYDSMVQDHLGKHGRASIQRKTFIIYTCLFSILIVLSILIMIYQFKNWNKERKELLYSFPVRAEIMYQALGSHHEINKLKTSAINRQIFIDCGEEGDTRSEFSFTDTERMKYVEQWLNKVAIVNCIRINSRDYNTLRVCSNQRVDV